MNRLNPRERKLVAVGLLVLVLALAWLLAVQPLLQGFADRRAERESLSETLRQDARLVRLLPVYRRQAAAQARDGADYAFATGDPAVALSAAQARVGAAVLAAGGVLHAVRDQPAPAGRIRLRADAALTLPALVGLLTRLQDSRPYAVVDGLSVASGDPAAPQPAPLEVRVDLVYAFNAPH